MDEYKYIKFVGKGTYGQVFKTFHGPSKQYRAVKQIQLIRDDTMQEMRGECGIPATALTEITILRKLQHPNVVALLDIMYSQQKLCLAFEFMHYDLRKFLDSNSSALDDDTIKCFTKQLLQGLEYIHSEKIIHRDITPRNVVLTRDKRLRIIDFGLACTTSLPRRAMSCEVVTLWYRAPELLLGCRDYDYSVDLWGVGCILAEMVLKQPLFPGSSVDAQLQLIFRLLGEPSKDSWEGAFELPRWQAWRAFAALDSKSTDLDSEQHTSSSEYYSHSNDNGNHTSSSTSRTPEKGLHHSFSSPESVTMESPASLAQQSSPRDTRPPDDDLAAAPAAVALDQAAAQRRSRELARRRSEIRVLARVFDGFDKNGIELVSMLLQCAPSARVCAADALCLLSSPFMPL